jgi:hypothetical protein
MRRYRTTWPFAMRHDARHEPPIALAAQRFRIDAEHPARGNVGGGCLHAAIFALPALAVIRVNDPSALRVNTDRYP